MVQEATIADLQKYGFTLISVASQVVYPIGATLA
jgi:hypothetical protein